MLEVQFLGHSFFRLSFPSASVLVDPFISCPKSHGVKRLVECPVKAGDVKKADLVLITHEHFDHFDRKAVEAIASKNGAFVVAHESVLNSIPLPPDLLRPVKVGERVVLKGVEIEPVPAHHPNSFYPMGFVVSQGGHSVYHAGDTDLIEDFSKVKAKIALLPIGGNFTMDCVDAVRATKSIKPDYVIPMHYNTFASICCSPEEFKARIDKSILKTQTVILKPGQSFKLK